MKTKMLSRGLMMSMTAGAFLAVLSGCQSDNISVPVQEQYNRDFIKQFGVPSGQQSWNTAKQVNARIDASVLSKADRVEILTAWPGTSDSRVLASYKAADAADFNFDVPQGLDRVYVRAIDANGRVVADGYRTIRANAMAFEAQAENSSVNVSLFDLTQSPAFGSALVTDRNKATWTSFIGNNGLPVYSEDSKTLVYTDYTPLELKLNVSKSDTQSEWEDMPEDGVDFANYDKCIMVAAPGKLATPAVATKIAVKVILEKIEGTLGYSNIELCHGGVGDWKSFGSNSVTEDIGVEAEYVYELNDDDAREFIANGARIQGCDVKVKGLQFKELDAASDPYVRYADVFNIYGFTTGGPASDINGYISNHLGPDNSLDPAGYSASDLVPLVGKNGVFHEEVNDEMKCNLDLYRDKLGLDKGVEYRVVQDSEVGINFFFGCASYFNSLGYFYYTDAEADNVEALLKKPKFIIIANAYPGHNIKFDRGTAEAPDFQHETPYSQLEKANGTGDYATAKADEGKDKSDDWAHPMLPKRLVDHVDPEVNGPAEEGYTGKMQSAYYKLVHYDIDSEGKPIEGSASYTFPAGTHVAFFIIQGGYYWIERNGDTSQKVNNIRLAFSLPQLNDAIGNTFHTSHSHAWTGQNAEGEGGYSMVSNVGGDVASWTPFASYLWNGKTVMGVEDMPCEPDGKIGFAGGDHDMNDLLFNVSGRIIREEDEELIPEAPKTMSWIVACEDLGVTDDFDFNDVVFGVTHAAGETTAKITALASGGTLPVYLSSVYPQIVDGQEVTNENGILIPAGSNGGEFHSWWGSDKPSSQIVNARNYQHGRGAEVEISVPADFSLATAGDPESAAPTHGRPADGDSNMGGFKVLVKKNGNLSTTITAPRYEAGFEAPQMFLVPSSWHWPAERQIITGVYTKFIDFEDGWWEQKDGPDAHNRIHHDWR